VAQEKTRVKAKIPAPSYTISEKAQEDFGALFRLERMTRGLTLGEVARETGVSDSLLSSLERGVAKGTSLVTTLIVARYYDIEPNEIARVLGLLRSGEGKSQFSPEVERLAIQLAKLAPEDVERVSRCMISVRK
jgi:transcriptional regulator with XRE-family HTH domain